MAKKSNYWFEGQPRTHIITKNGKFAGYAYNGLVRHEKTYFPVREYVEGLNEGLQSKPFEVEEI